MSHATIVNRSQLLSAATALTAVGFFTVAPPAQAGPMSPLPLAPPCSQYGFGGIFELKQSNGDTVRFNATGPVVSASTPALATGGSNGTLKGLVGGGGGIRGDRLDFEISWDHQSQGHYTGLVGGDGFAHGDTYDELSTNSARWDSTVPLVCTITTAPPTPASAPAPAQQPALPDAQTAAARLGVAVNGPTTLPAGQSGTYTVSVSNPGDLSAPVELFISFNGNLRQTGQPAPSGGFDCTVNNYAGGTSSVHCTVGQFGSKATANITVQGQGSAPGPGQLVVNINSSDPAAQFVQKSQQLNVSIT